MAIEIEPAGLGERQQSTDCVEKVGSNTSREITPPKCIKFIPPLAAQSVVEAFSPKRKERSSPFGIRLRRVWRQPDFFNTIDPLLTLVARIEPLS